MLKITVPAVLAGAVGAALLMATFAAFPKLNFIARIPPIGGRMLRAA